MTNVVDSILGLMSEPAALSQESQNEPLANAVADAPQAMQEDNIFGRREDWVYQTVMRSLVETGALGVGVSEAASLRTQRLS